LSSSTLAFYTEVKSGGEIKGKQFAKTITLMNLAVDEYNVRPGPTLGLPLGALTLALFSVSMTLYNKY